MAEININVETTVSTTIRLDAVSLEKYFRILNYIESVTGKKTPIFPNPTFKTGPKEEKNEEKTREEKYARLPRYKGYEKIAQVFRDAEAHPEGYTWESMLSKAWKSMVPELKEVPDHTVAHVLGSMVILGITEKRVEKNSVSCIPENFYRVPIPKATEGKSETAVNPMDQRMGAILRKARREHNFSIPELSSSIGYGADIIVKWETGVYHMAETAIRAICEFFKKDIFAEAEEESA